MLDSADAIHYLEAARSIARGDFFGVDPKIPVLYPLFTAGAGLALGSPEVSGQIVSFFFSALLVAPVYFLSRELHGARVARIAGALVAVWPWLLDYSNRVATEPTAVFFWILGALCLVRGFRRDGGPRWMVGAGVAFGALHLARAEGTFVLLGALGAGAIAGPGDWKRTARRLGVYALTAGVVLAAHAAYLHGLTGRWTVNYRVGFIGEQPEGSTVMAELARTLLAMSADVPAVMLGPLLWAFFGIGVFARREPGGPGVRGEWIVLYLAVVQWLVVIPVLSPAPRYLMSGFVALSLWSARGVESAGAVLAGRAARARHLPLAAVMVWMAMHLAAAIGAEHFGRGVPRQPWEYKIAGEWMREHLRPGPVVARKPQVGFYAEMPTRGLQAEAGLGEIVAEAVESGARYLVVDERYGVELVPALRPLLNPANAPDTLRLVSADASPYPHARVVIYEFAGEADGPK
jgi:4-amino-4-deoxy-L-arabinose transferase-like glycosyltransferase